MGTRTWAAIGWLVLALAAPSQADEWASRVFDTVHHDFGAIRRGEVVHHTFQVANPDPQPLRISHARASCGCSRVIACTDPIPPGSSVPLTIEMDTSRFQGHKSVTIDVHFDQPWRRQVALRVSCESTADVRDGANEVDFGVVPAGQGAERRMYLDYPGDASWQVLGIDRETPNVEVSIQERSRSQGLVRYELAVRLRETAPPGRLDQPVGLRTNDPRQPLVMVHVRATIEAELVVSPPVLRLERLAAGQQMTRHVVVKASQPFRVVRADNTRKMFQVLSSPEPRTVQMVVLTLTMPEDPATITPQIDLVTDLGADRIASVRVEQAP